MSNLATITNNILADSGIDDINVVVTTGSYANPAWITSLAWSKITGAPLGDYLPLAGGTMTGNINWAQTDRGITWAVNTDGASIKFYNTGDGDTDSRLEFATIDNNNEYFRWVHIPSGGSLYESMRLVPNSSGNAQLTVSGAATFSSSVTAQNMYSISDNSEQIVIKTSTDNNKQLIFGRTTNDARIIAVTQGVGYAPLLLNPSGGSIGIGTTSPSATLDVRGTMRSEVSSNPTNAILFQLTNQTTSSPNGCKIAFDVYNVGAAAIGMPSNSADLVFYANGNSTERMRITSGGNVGIGTTTPNSYSGYTTLTINSNTSGSVLDLDYNNVRTATVAIDANAFYVGSEVSIPMLLQTNGTERMRITSVGNVGIGTTSPDSRLVSNYGTLTTFNSSDIRTTTALLLTASDPGTTSSSHAVSLAFRPIQNRGAAATLTVFNDSVNKEGGTIITFNSGGGAYPTSVTERFRIWSDGKIRFNQYGTGLFTGTVAYNLAVDSSGNIIETAGGVVDGSGTTNYVSKWSDPNTLTNSLIYDNGTNVGIGTTAPINTGLTVQTSGAAFSTTATKNSNMYGLTLVSTTNENTMSGVWFGSGGGSHWSGIAGSRSNYTVDWSTHLSFYTHVANTVNITDATEKMRITGEGDVGIGTSSPTSQANYRFLQVNATNSAVIETMVGGNRIGGFDSDASNLYVGTIGSYPIVFRTAVVERMRITSGGFVGIGESSPISKLTVTDSNQFVARFYNSAVNQLTTVQVANQAQSTAGVNTAAATFELVGKAGSSTHGRHAWIGAEGVAAETFRTKLLFKLRGESNSGYTWSGASEAPTIMTLDGNGLVGIGTTTPLTALHVNDGVNVSNLTMLTLSQLGNTGNRDVVNLRMSFNNGNTPGTMLSAIKQSDASSALSFSTGAASNGALAEWMRITGSGNVGIGTTSPQSGVKLDVYGAAAVAGGSEGLRIGNVGDNSAYDNVKLWYTGYNGGAPRVYLTPRQTPGSGIVNTFLHLTNSNGGSTTANNTMGLIVDGSGTFGASTSGNATVTVSSAGACVMDLLNAQTEAYIRTTTYHDLYFRTNNINRMVVSKDGNVGIGTTSPSTKLDINGSITTGTTGGASVNITTSGNSGTSGSPLQTNLNFYGYNSNLNGQIRVDDISGSAQIGTMKFYTWNSAQVLALTLAHTGAATFSSSVQGTILTATSYFTSDYYRDSRLEALLLYAGSNQIRLGSGVAADFLTFYGGGSERMRITSGGNVGIGTSSPIAKLTVDNTTNNTWLSINNARNSGSSPTYGLSITTSHASSSLNDVNHYGAYIVPNFTTSASNLGSVYGAFIQPTESGFYNIGYGYGLYVQAITVNSGTISNNYAAVFMGGNVGIGTSTPTSILDASLSGGATSGFRFKGWSDASTPYLLSLGTQTYQDIFQIKAVNGLVTMGIVGSVGSTPDLAFQTNTTERMRIKSSGFIGIGTTSPTALLHVNDGSYNRFTLRVQSAAANNSNGYGGIGFSGEESNTKGGIFFQSIGQSYSRGRMIFAINNVADQSSATPSNAVLTLNNDGSSTFVSSVTATAYYESSDIRLKQVLNLHNGQDFGAIEYRWADARDSKLHWGYSAQEVMKFLPDAVAENEDGFLTLDYNQAHTYKIAMLEKRIAELEKQLKNK